MARRIQGDGFVVIDRSGDVLRSAQNAIERAVARGAILVQIEAKRLLNLKASPPPSVPGEPPGKRTGNLGRSIQTESVQRKGEFIGIVGTNVKYGFWLELGTRRMAPRPFLRPALDAMRSRIVQEIAAAGKEIR